MQGQVTHATWPAGAARNNNGFVLDIAPDATAHDAMFVASVTAADGGTWQFSVPFAIAAPRIDIVHRRSWLFDPEPGGNRDGNANPGERVLPVVRLLNSGPSTALNVLVALEFDDPSVTVIRGAMSRARWEPGAAFTHSGFAIRIAHGSTPHDVTATLRVSADNGGPWDFPFVFPIAYRPVEFAQRNAWIFDPAPGGDGDGEMEAGERVFPRFRLRNIGVDEGRNVIVRLLTHDRHATVVAGEVTHASWPAGEARNNDGFVVEIDPLSESHDVEFIVKVEADGGVSRVFAYTFAITTPPVHIAVQRAALLDRGNYNGIVEPGEGVWPQFRLRHTGSQPATGLRATLIATDDDITITRADASRGTLNPGVVWEIKFLRMRTAADAIPHDTAIALIVTADSGGPWRFDVPMQLGADFGIRVRSAASADPAPGGNANGQTNPGETVELRIVVANDSLMQLDNVQTTITVDDPDVTVTGGVDPVAEWPRGSEHNRTFVFPAEVAPDARSHSVPVVVTMAADGMEPVSHTWDFSIVALPPDFELRNAWVWEPPPAGNGDGDVNPGERVFPRVRLRNVGAGPGQIVQASLVVLDPDVDIVSGFVTHDSWPVGEARNNNGLVLDISPDATPHDVTVVLSVVADDAGPWGFSFTMPIVAAQVETTALLANFPNPFNPETWIPFDLSEAAEVTVTVYDARGMLVRRLDLGRLPSGVYRGRSTAAYWDGRNDIGEQVSSGAYIYELRAGAHREMRRMIVRK
ncbi:hypothetical protein HOI71_12310 [Candidatus Poribacteria bacterium]|nr:hypothetical protein [Candidatus Poribacteria bacterium]